jgi:XTP/dITP diphosphohydrolase
MTTLLIATRNTHKVAEIRAILAGHYACLSQNDIPGAPTILEDEETFAGNARKKAEGLAAWLAGNSLPLANGAPDFILADDSGLEVDVLGGAPGVHSARYAAEETCGPVNAPDAANNAKLLRLLATVPPERRAARFRCVLALAPLPSATANGTTMLFEGSCEGRIGLAPAGSGGFGYDPLFVPDGWNQSLAELGESVKNTISHRARALQKLRQFLLNER